MVLTTSIQVIIFIEGYHPYFRLGVNPQRKYRFIFCSRIHVCIKFYSVNMANNILVIANSFLPSARSGLLTREGYKVDTINNTEANLSWVDYGDYDIVILQAGRETSEWQLCEQIRRFSCKPLIVISTHTSVDMSIKAIDAGADYFLKRPFGPMELSAKIRSLLQRPSLKTSEPVAV